LFVVRERTGRISAKYRGVRAGDFCCGRRAHEF
jgi:hypothetical protein